ncbi:MAG: hypothetical protein MR426_08050, partial [Clostridiales bacterium]|nr:hypothetical protein [Clostridiales bacterium]
MGTNCMPFNQARGSVTLRAAGSRPYDGIPTNYNLTSRWVKPESTKTFIWKTGENPGFFYAPGRLAG